MIMLLRYLLFTPQRIKLVHFLALTQVEKKKKKTHFHILYQSMPQSPPPWFWGINEKVNCSDQKGKFAHFCSEYKHQEHLKEHKHEQNLKLFLKHFSSSRNPSKMKLSKAHINQEIKNPSNH